jgi:hypothetical protein
MNPLMLPTTILKIKAISHASLALVAPIILEKIVSRHSLLNHSKSSFIYAFVLLQLLLLSFCQI